MQPGCRPNLMVMNPWTFRKQLIGMMLSSVMASLVPCYH
uniref:Uncharacterized protein n=1 Tax=Arundo donax TaxID=35708 RepID=A0A0A9GNW9_ARUDO